MVRIIRHRHAPTHRRLQSTDGKILKPTTHKTADFIPARLRSNEIRLRLIDVEQRFGVIGEPEEITFFRYAIERRVVNQIRRDSVWIRRGAVRIVSLVSSTRRADPAFVLIVEDR